MKAKLDGKGMIIAAGDDIRQSPEKELKADVGLHTATAGKAKMHERCMTYAEGEGIRQNERGFEGIVH
eukprot:9451823-Alexandrium_andersonii.AAC.1